MIGQQTNGPVWEHLVIELTKVDQPCSRVVGLGGGSMGAVPTADSETDAGRAQVCTHITTYYAEPNGCVCVSLVSWL